MTRFTSFVRAPMGALLALATCASVASTQSQESAAPFRYETQRVDDHSARRAAELAAALGFAGWPEPPELYAAPAVFRGLLKNPGAVAEEVRACTTVAFGEEAWPQCTWSWKGRAAEGRKSVGEDWLDVQATVAPSSRAAKEFLLASLADNQLPTEAVVARYTSAERPARLGDVALLVKSPKGDDTSVSFMRANLVFRIRGHGALAEEALPLAVRLDERLAGQAPLTPEELRTRSREPLPRR
jgi:hypothetical protein